MINAKNKASRSIHDFDNNTNKNGRTFYFCHNIAIKPYFGHMTKGFYGPKKGPSWVYTKITYKM